MSGYFAEFAGEVEDREDDDLDDFDLEAPDTPVKKSEGASPRMEAYFAELERRMRIEYRVAEQCRALGLDPELHVEIPPATDLAARCEELMKDYLPERGVAERIRVLSKLHNREETSLIVAKEVAAGKFGKFDSLEKAVDGAVRVGLAILTEGILVAPLEGIAGVRVLPNDDGTQCIAVAFAGPIRAAGGTGQALSVLIADVVRRELGIDRYKPTEQEVMRLKEEIPAYKMAANLQYTPTGDEIDLIVRNCPIMIDGEGTEKDEVGGNRDLPRIETNQIRGGACLVIAEGLTLKAPKIQKHVKNLKLEGWDFIDRFVNKGKKDDNEDADVGADGKPSRPRIDPNPKFMADLIAGRPVFSHPSRKGGWRLRYGRSRTGGLATLAMHPAAMTLVDDFLAVGTQMKIERPGKATVATPCDTIEPPVVLLHNGSLVELPTVAAVHEKRASIKRIVDLGEMLVPYGEFVENNKNLPQASYCVEWWEQEVARAVGDDSRPQGAAVTTSPPSSSHVGIVRPDDGEDAFRFAERTRTPLHPDFNLFWHDLSIPQVLSLARFVHANGRWTADGRLVLPKVAAEEKADDAALTPKELLVELGALHDVEGEAVVLTRYAYSLVRCLGLEPKGAQLVSSGRSTPANVDDPCELVSALCGVRVRPRAPHRIGTRMGRPEKAAERKMAPPVHGLFPIGNAGGPQRLMKEAARVGAIDVEIGQRVCPICKTKSVHMRCRDCEGEHGVKAHTVFTRANVGANGRPEPVRVPFDELFQDAVRRLGVDRLPDVIKGVQGLISRSKTPEPIEKAILRATHGIFTFKDGTARFDMTDITLTHFKPREVFASVEKLKELGYDKDIHGEALERDDQTLELMVQDIVVSTSCLDYMLKCTQFVDDELRRLYGFKAYYNCKVRDDLIGHLFVALAPHTSGGVLCRIIGHTKAQGHFGHPYFHAAKRRNCVDPDAELLLFENGELRRERIGPWVDRLIEERGWGRRVLDAFGTEKLPLPRGAQVVTLDPVTRKPRLLDVTSVIRGWTERWVRFETESGRSFLATPDHNVLTEDEGRWVVKPMEKVDVGDLVPLASTLDLPERIPEWDLAASLAEDEGGLRVKGASSTLKELVRRVGRAKVAAVAGLDPGHGGSLARWAFSPTLNALSRLVDAGLLQWDELPPDARLRHGRDKATLPLRIAADAPLARVLGAYVAAGRARHDARRRAEVRLSVPPGPAADTLAADLAALFGAPPSRDGPDLVLAGRLPRLLLAHVLGAGETPDERRVPHFAATLPRALVAAFAEIAEVVRGGVFPNERAASDVATLLLRLGVPTRIEGARLVRTNALAEYVRDRVVKVETVDAPGNTYCIDVDSGSVDLATKNVLWANQLYQIRCDGDEDCVMLLLDGLLNFSRAYLPSNRGGLMDAPLTLTMRIDPSEVDKEAHNVDSMWKYPLEFFEATLRHPGPKDVEKLIETVAKRLGTPGQYEGIGFTHDTADIAEGPDASAYKTIGSMMEKMEAQLDLALKLRAVDAPDVAARVIGSHFLPDLMGNLKAFSKQAMRCTKCGAKYRRIPIAGRCIRNNCAGNLTMTVFEASVKKYLEVSKQICEKYSVHPYVRQRLEHIEDSIDSLFSNDRVKKAKLSDFF